MSNILITGNSSGLGLGLTRHYLARGDTVFGCSRRGCPEQGQNLHDKRIDLADFDSIAPALAGLLGPIRQLDLVYLNAGILGRTVEMHKARMAELKQLMDINVWSNKVIMDWLLDWSGSVTQVVMISSGSSVRGSKGWNGYAISKAALNMLARLYAHECPATHVSAVAPGLVDTGMMDYLCAEPSPATFPALQSLRDARGTPDMPTPAAAAARIAGLSAHFRTHASGSYLDIRTL